MRQRRLRKERAFCGAPEVPFFRDQKKMLKLAQVHSTIAPRLEAAGRCLVSENLSQMLLLINSPIPGGARTCRG